MNAFLQSIKADLLDVRLRLAVALLTLGLVAAVAYALLGGSSSSSGAASSQGRITTPGIAVSLAPANPEAPVAETSNGSSHQRHGVVHDPFNPLPGSEASLAAAKAAAATATATASPTTAAKTGSSAQGTGVTTPAAPAAPAKPSIPSKPSVPAKPKTREIPYHVAVLFGPVPAGTPPQSLQLTPYENLGHNEPLPSSTQPLLVFRGVATGGASATFTLIGEAILHGNAACTPSPSQCQSISLTVGQSEELEYLQPNGQAQTYQLQLVSITAN